MSLKEKLSEIVPARRETVSKLVRNHGEKIIDNITLAQIYGGMRDVKSLVTDISYVDSLEGIRLRGHSIPEVLQQLPKEAGSEMPLVGGLYYLLLVGEIPTLSEAQEVEHEWKNRFSVPTYVFDVLNAMPKNASPMTMFSQAILSMQGESIFTREYIEGLKKDQYWVAMLEDSMNLTAVLPALAAYIYNLIRGSKKILPLDDTQDWAANYGIMMGIDDGTYHELTRLYMIIHSDHESGNVSAHTTHLVGSALSDIYYAASSGMNGLAGPLHGRANQETLNWLLDLYKRFHGVPSEGELTLYAWDTLNSGMVIPGYGHAVLRKTDPRYSVLYDFGRRYFPDDELFQLAALVYKVIPDILKEHGKAKNPWPNVDAISGVLLHHYEVDDCMMQRYGCGYYTVMFGVSRILGISANAVWARALGQPIERPKSITTEMLTKIVGD
jgi:citrate synthase